MQPRRAGTIWSNDDVALAQATKQASAELPVPPSQAKASSKAAKQSIEVAENSSDDEEEYQELPSAPGSDADESASDIEEQPTGDAAVLDEGISDLEYLKSRVRANVGAQDGTSSSQTSSLTDTHQVC